MQTTLSTVLHKNNPFYEKTSARADIIEQLTSDTYRGDRVVISDQEIYKLQPNALVLMMFIVSMIGRYGEQIQLISSFISKETGLSRPTITKAIKELVDKEYLAGRGNNRMYWININKIFKY